MIAAIRRCLPLGLALLTAIAFGLSAASAQPRTDADLLREARRERDLATQKAEADLRATLDKTRKVSTAEALAMLKQTLADLEASKSIDETRKASMTQMLKDRIRISELAARTSGQKPAEPPAEAIKSGRDERRRAELEQQEAERLKVKESVNTINRLLGQRRNDEAERQARELARQFPNNTAAKAMDQRASLQVRIRDAKELLDKQEDNINRAMKDVATKLPSGDLEFDKDITRRNNKSKFRGFGDPLTEKEQAILKALSKTLKPDFQGSKFDTVIEFLQTTIGTPIALDRKALDDASIGTDTTVNFTLPREVSVRTILRKVLQDQGLGYVIKDEMIHVTTISKIRDMMTTRTYSIADLVTGNALTTPPALLAEQEAMIVKIIIDTIKRSVDPMSWDGEGTGKATIHYEPVTKTLVIRQSAEVHMLLRNSMAR